MVRECWTRLVGVEVEEIVALAADKVVGAAWPAAGYADRLCVRKGGFEGFMVDGCYAVWTQANSKQDEGRLDGGVGGVG
jgi:hypothetical protein